MSWQREHLIEMLKDEWLTNFEAQQILKSSSADRVIRFIRSNPPSGYIVIQRWKEASDEYNRCYEYRLVKGSRSKQIFENINKILGIEIEN